MAAKKAIQVGTKTVRPVLSLDSSEARSRVLSLYKAWYRQIPYIGLYHGYVIRIFIHNKLFILYNIIVFYLVYSKGLRHTEV